MQGYQRLSDFCEALWRNEYIFKLLPVGLARLQRFWKTSKYLIGNGALQKFLAFVFVFCIFSVPRYFTNCPNKQQQRKPAFASVTHNLQCILFALQYRQEHFWPITSKASLITFFYLCKYLSCIIKTQYFPNSEPQIFIYHIPHLISEFLQKPALPTISHFNYHLPEYEVFVTVF